MIIIILTDMSRREVHAMRHCFLGIIEKFIESCYSVIQWQTGSLDKYPKMGIIAHVGMGKIDDSKEKKCIV